MQTQTIESAHLQLARQRKTNLSTVERLSAKEEENTGLDEMLRTARLDVENLNVKNKSLSSTVHSLENDVADHAFKIQVYQKGPIREN